HQIEDAIEQLGFMAECILEKLEARDALAVERDQFAIQHGVGFHPLKRLRDFDITVADDLAVATVERDVPGLDAGDHTEAVVLVLEDPIGVVERRVRERSKHWLKSL